MVNEIAYKNVDNLINQIPTANFRTVDAF